MKVKITKPNGNVSEYEGELIESNKDEILLKDAEGGIVRITVKECKSVEVDGKQI